MTGRQEHARRSSRQGTPPSEPITVGSGPRRPVPQITFEDKSLHEFRDAVTRAWTTLAFVPVLAGFGAVEMFHHVRGRVVQPHLKPRPHRFNRPATMPPRSERSVADVVAELERYPYRPTRLGPRLAFHKEFAADGVSLLFHVKRRYAGLLYQYPPVFEPRLFPGAEGERLAGLQAMHSMPGPALVIAHGLLSTKNSDYIRRVAMRAYAKWGFHVVVVDLRSWGASGWTTDAPCSGGYMEGQDLVEVARFLRDDPAVTSVGVLGYSLGGISALNAARFSSLAEDGPINGGVMTVSAPTDLQMALERVTARPNIRDPFFPMWLVFRLAIHAGVRDRGWYPLSGDIRKLFDNFALPYYGLTLEQLTEIGSPVNFAGDISIPTLALHADDDIVVPGIHAERLAAAAQGNEMVHVMRRHCGDHCAFGAVDNRWYRSVVRRWFEYWAE